MTTTPSKHSPIIGWMLDGLPVYGPYGYSSALDAMSGVRRMIGGFVLRNGATTGADNVSTTGRTLPTWSTRNGATAATGPTVSTTYPLGRYLEDWAYLGDLIKTGSTKYAQGIDFDLNEYNVRYCVTPEFPSGTYAYFLCISSTGTPQFPYMINRWMFGTPTGGAVTSVTETVTNQFKGGEYLTEAASMGTVNSATGTATLLWSSVEGGSYKVEASNDLSTWSTLANSQAATTSSTTSSYTEANATNSTSRFYRIQRSALATYDGGGGYSYAPPTASTSAPSNVGITTSTLNASVNANSNSTTITFEYGLTTSYGSTTAAVVLTSSSSTAVTATLSGLSAETVYHYRVKAVNNYGTTYGSNISFTTLAIGAQLPPTVTTNAATAIATNTGTLNASVNANGAASSTSFEYGTTTAYGGVTTATNITGSSSSAVSATLTGLTASTTYFFRVKSMNTGGTSYGAAQTFTTSAAVVEGISSVTPNSGSRGSSATLTVVLNTAYAPAPPPSTVAPTAANLTRGGATTINATSYTRNSTTGVVTLNFTLPAGATVGSYTVNVTFGPNTWSMANGFTVN